jgi:hypothetical protein
MVKTEQKSGSAGGPFGPFGPPLSSVIEAF